MFGRSLASLANTNSRPIQTRPTYECSGPLVGRAASRQRVAERSACGASGSLNQLFSLDCVSRRVKPLATPTGRRRRKRKKFLQMQCARASCKFSSRIELARATCRTQPAPDAAAPLYARGACCCCWRTSAAPAAYLAAAAAPKRVQNLLIRRRATGAAEDTLSALPNRRTKQTTNFSLSLPFARQPNRLRLRPFE